MVNSWQKQWCFGLKYSGTWQNSWSHQSSQELFNHQPQSSPQTLMILWWDAFPYTQPQLITKCTLHFYSELTVIHDSRVYTHEYLFIPKSLNQCFCTDSIRLVTVSRFASTLKNFPWHADVLPSSPPCTWYWLFIIGYWPVCRTPAVNVWVEKNDQSEWFRYHYSIIIALPPVTPDLLITKLQWNVSSPPLSMSQNSSLLFLFWFFFFLGCCLCLCLCLLWVTVACLTYQHPKHLSHLLFWSKDQTLDPLDVTLVKF